MCHTAIAIFVLRRLHWHPLYAPLVKNYSAVTNSFVSFDQLSKFFHQQTQQ